MKNKVAIIGAGFFGLSIAFYLKKKFQVTVFEKNSDILTGASRANQLRFHLGYHYPRSQKTDKKINDPFLLGRNEIIRMLAINEV